MKIFAPGRQLDDYGHAVIRYENGALGTVTISQITHGRENDHTIEIDGTKAAIAWRQEESQSNDRPPQRPAARDLHPRSQRPLYERSGQGRLPHPVRPSRRLSSRRSPTSTVRRSTRSSSGRRAKHSSPATRSIQTFTTASKGCISSSNASPRARKTPPGCRSSTALALDAKLRRTSRRAYSHGPAGIRSYPIIVRRTGGINPPTRWSNLLRLVLLQLATSIRYNRIFPAGRSRRVVPQPIRYGCLRQCDAGSGRAAGSPQ